MEMETLHQSNWLQIHSGFTGEGFEANQSTVPTVKGLSLQILLHFQEIVIFSDSKYLIYFFWLLGWKFLWATENPDEEVKIISQYFENINYCCWWQRARSSENYKKVNSATFDTFRRCILITNWISFVIIAITYSIG